MARLPKLREIGAFPPSIAEGQAPRGLGACHPREPTGITQPLFLAVTTDKDPATMLPPKLSRRELELRPRRPVMFPQNNISKQILELLVRFRELLRRID